MKIVDVWFHEHSSPRSRHSGSLVASRTGNGRDRRPADSNGAPAQIPMLLQRVGSARRSRRRRTTANPGAGSRQDRRHAPAGRRIRRTASARSSSTPAARAAARSTRRRRSAPICSAAVNDHFDIVAFDPRGIGESSPSIDCKVNQETDGLYSAPFTTPENLDVNALLAKDKAYVKRCVELNKAHPAVRLDRQRRA